MTPSGMKPATLRLVAQCLNKLRHRMPHLFVIQFINVHHGYNPSEQLLEKSINRV
jgi:hypothetical protein